MKKCILITVVGFLLGGNIGWYLVCRKQGKMIDYLTSELKSADQAHRQSVKQSMELMQKVFESMEKADREKLNL